MMSALADKLKGNWNQIRGKMKEEYAVLTEDELLYEEGKEEQLLGIIEEKTGQTKEQIISFINGL